MPISLQPINTLVIASFLFVATGAAEADTLKAGEIRREIAGHTVILTAPVGGEIPLIYRANGSVSANGSALGVSQLPQPRDNGRWWVSGDRLCQRFTTWFGGAPMCFDLVRVEPRRLKWTGDGGQSGFARIAD
jgi:hypothetical protein